MDRLFHSQRSDTQQPGAFLAALLMIFNNALGRLVSLIQLTEEEQRDAGIYLDNPGGE